MLCPAMSMLLIPDKPGAKVLPFHLAENQLEPLIEEIKKVWCYHLYQQQIYIDLFVGCILP